MTLPHERRRPLSVVGGPASRDRPAHAADRASPQGRQAALAVALDERELRAALVLGPRVSGDRVRRPLPEDDDERAAAIVDVAERWSGRYGALGIAVGGVRRQASRAVAPSADGALADRVATALGRPAVAHGAAQAAAWAEHRFGAGEGRDLAYLDVGTGVDGALVIGGRLVTGHRGPAARTGLLPEGPEGAPIESTFDTRWIERVAETGGAPIEAEGVLAAAERRDFWADLVLETSAASASRLCTMLRWLVDPELIVVGGPVGLVRGYAEKIRETRPGFDDVSFPPVVRAALGADGALVGVADLARGAPGA